MERYRQEQHQDFQRFGVDFSHLLHDRLARRTGAGPSGSATRSSRGAHLQEVGRAALLRERRALPARPLRQGDLPEVRHARPVRRRLREVRDHLRPAGAEGPALRALRHLAGGPRERPRLRQPRRRSSRAHPRLGGGGGAPRAGGPRAGEGLARRPAGLVHHPRRALLRLPGERPRLPRQVHLRLARRAHRLPLQRRALLRRRGAGRRRLDPAAYEAAYLAPGSPARLEHFIGKDILRFHAVFWPAMLWARGAEAARPAGRARPPHRERREDVQVARHLHHRQDLPRRGARPAAAPLLLRRQPRVRASPTSTSRSTSSATASTPTWPTTWPTWPRGSSRSWSGPAASSTGEPEEGIAGVDPARRCGSAPRRPTRPSSSARWCGS